MLIDYSILFIVALMPIVSLILVMQSNPYHALVIRAILGAVATLVYAVLGGADVALTEAMVGTLLAVALYIIAVRSSQVMRLGVLTGTEISAAKSNTGEEFNSIMTGIREVVGRYSLRLELVEYSDLKALNKAMEINEIHGICIHARRIALPGQQYILSLRVARLFEIFTREFQVAQVDFRLVQPYQEKH